MKKQRKIENDGLIVTHFGGLHSYKDAEEALNELIEINKGKKQIYEIAINYDDIKLDFKREEERILIKKVESTFGKFERGALAIVARQVAGRTLVYKLANYIAVIPNIYAT
jgi:hypothetical protein